MAKDRNVKKYGVWDIYYSSLLNTLFDKLLLAGRFSSHSSPHVTLHTVLDSPVLYINRDPVEI